MNAPRLVVPDLPADCDALTAALAYAAGGFYVGPLGHRKKHPATVLGAGWPRLTSTDPHHIAAWFAGTNHGVMLHAGRSGAVVFDVDAPEKLHPLLRRALDEHKPPYQSSRPGEAERGHYLFALPPGRMLGNSLGALASGWGEVRGRNGLIVVAPSVHEDDAGLYRWHRTGPVPVLPDYLAEALPDAMPTAESVATSGEVATFLDAHTTMTRPELVEVHARAFTNAVAAGESRHHTMTGHLAGAMREAAAGLVDARTAADTLQAVFLPAVAADGHGRQGKGRTPAEARHEWAGLLAWAVAQAQGADLAEVRARVADRVPAVEDWTAELSTAVDSDSAEVDAEPAGDDRDAAGASWEPVDLADVVAGLLAGTVTRHAPTIGRRDDGAALFYAGKVNGLAGASGSGKTWTALAACAQQLEDGQHVAYIDLEDDGVGIVGRLLDLGVNPENLAGPGRRFHYLHPEESFGLAAVEHLRRVLAEYAPALVVIDSTGESMALEGAKPNDDDDTARWFRKLPTPIARTGAAVLVLDHVVKAEDGGLWPIGSQRKRAAVSGAQYMQTTVRPFDKNTPGVAKLVCAKDRHGNYRPGQRVADLHVTPEHGAVTLDLRAPVEAPRGDRKWRPTALMERIAQALEDAGEALSFRSIDREVPGKADHLRTALRVLVEEGHVQVSEGPRNANLHTLVKPYAQRTDPDCELYAGEGHTRPSPDRVSVSVSLGRDTGHTHSTVSGTHSGHGGTHSPEEAVCRHLDCAEPARPGRVMCAMHFTREPARSA